MSPEETANRFAHRFAAFRGERPTGNSMKLMHQINFYPLDQCSASSLSEMSEIFPGVLLKQRTHQIPWFIISFAIKTAFSGVLGGLYNPYTPWWMMGLSPACLGVPGAFSVFPLRNARLSWCYMAKNCTKIPENLPEPLVDTKLVDPILQKKICLKHGEAMCQSLLTAISLHLLGVALERRENDS